MADLQFTESSSTFGIATDEEMYASCQKALQTIVEVGQSYTIMGGRQFTFASLSELRALFAYYEDKVLAARGDTGIYHADTGGRRNPSNNGTIS